MNQINQTIYNLSSARFLNELNFRLNRRGSLTTLDVEQFHDFDLPKRRGRSYYFSMIVGYVLSSAVYSRSRFLHSKYKKIRCNLARNILALSYLFFSIHNFSNPTPKSVLKHYKRSFSGFVMELTEDEANKIAGVYMLFIFLLKNELSFILN